VNIPLTNSIADASTRCSSATSNVISAFLIAVEDVSIILTIIVVCCFRIDIPDNLPT
jgi:hypothetical protein